MARTMKNSKKAPAPITPISETTEAHLDPGQFADMDDANLQQLARDMGLDPVTSADGEILIAAIAAEPVIPASPEGQEEGHGNQGTMEPVPITERPLPFRATVAAPVAVLRRAVIGTAEMVKPVATLDEGTAVTVVAFEGNSARLANGLYIKTNLLT